MQDGTLKVARIEDKRPTSAATHVISYQLDGFAITSTIETTAPIADVIARLKQIGATPAQTPAPEPTKAGGVPTCPVHNVAMAPSTKRPGTFYCKQSVGQHPDDGRVLYCTKKA